MARRNANGEGSIYKRKDGRYEGSVYVTTVTGRSKRFRVYGKTRAEVHDKLTDVKVQSKQGFTIEDQTWRLGDYLNYWLEEVVQPHRRPTTYEQYKWAVNGFLKRGLGHHVLRRLSV